MYVQQKHVRVRDYLSRTDRAQNPGVRTENNFGASNPGVRAEDFGAQNPGVRAVMSVECLEGVLVGIHREGNEEPFYTISLSTPIPGSAGNTVREIQTSGYRYVTNFLIPL